MSVCESVRECVTRGLVMERGQGALAAGACRSYLFSLHTSATLHGGHIDRMWKQGSERVSTLAPGHPGEMAELSLDNVINKAGDTNIVY